MNNKNLPILKQDSELVTLKTKSLLGLKNRLIQKKDLVDDSWMERLWRWADENDISDYYLPRNKEKLLKLKVLELISTYQSRIISDEIIHLKTLKKLHISGYILSEKQQNWILNLKKTRCVVDITKPQFNRTFKNIENILKWADENHIPENIFPREYDLFEISELDLSNCNLKELPNEMDIFENLYDINLINNKELILTKRQIEWILNCTPYISLIFDADDNLFYRNTNKEERVEDWIINLWKWVNNNNSENFTAIEHGYDFDCNINEIKLLFIEKDLIELKKLNLFSTNISYIPKEIGNLTSLTELSISENQLTELPKEIGKLSKLKYFYLSVNSLTKLPKDMENLTNLAELSIFENQLTELPKEIGDLTSLTTLNVEFNQLVKLPKEIGKLSKLKYFYLSVNSLTKLPKDMGNLTNLAELSIFENQLTELPKEIGNLTNLTKLDLGLNQLIKLPKEIGNLTNLTSLNLGINTYMIEKYIYLTELNLQDLKGNQLLELPREIINLTNLKKLHLENNPDLTLTEEQKNWIINLHIKGCQIGIDSHLFNRYFFNREIKNSRYSYYYSITIVDEDGV